jgi:hypothetical protein
MARSRTRSGGGGGGGGKGGAGQARAAKSRKPAPVAEVEVVEESGGMTIDDGIPIITTILLIAAFVLVDYALGTQYGEGMFFK